MDVLSGLRLSNADFRQFRGEYLNYFRWHMIGRTDMHVECASNKKKLENNVKKVVKKSKKVIRK